MDIFEELKSFLTKAIDGSRNDLSGTNDYHQGREDAYESVLNWLEEQKL